MFKNLFTNADQNQHSLDNYVTYLNKELDLQEQLLEDHQEVPHARPPINEQLVSQTLQEPGLPIQVQDHDQDGEFVDVDLVSRDEERQLQQIHQELHLVKGVMDSINSLVYEQGEQVSHIEDSIQITSNRAEAGVEHLERAEEYQKRAIIRRIKVASGALLGGVLFGGVGATFGVLQAVVGTGLGSGTGAFTGWLL